MSKHTNVFEARLLLLLLSDMFDRAGASTMLEKHNWHSMQHNSTVVPQLSFVAILTIYSNLKKCWLVETLFSSLTHFHKHTHTNPHPPISTHVHVHTHTL